ncbi:MAG: PIN domain-containing protein [Flavobacterium sp.]
MNLVVDTNIVFSVLLNPNSFIALALQMNSKLWSGDKKLTQGLIKKKSDIILTTQDTLKIKP